MTDDSRATSAEQQPKQQPKQQPSQQSKQRPVELREGSLRWPLGIALGLLVVVLVNAAFAYVAITGADEVAPSYQTEQR